MANKLTSDIEKSCALCEYARYIKISDETLCTRTKNLKKVDSHDCCRKFSFDLLSYKPNPTKLPDFSQETKDDIL